MRSRAAAGSSARRGSTTSSAMSGDYPVTGHRGMQRPVFDIDSVGLLDLFAQMNAGLHDRRTPTSHSVAPTSSSAAW